MLKSAKISNFRWHDLRHRYASLLRMGGTDLEDIGALLGHKTLAMTGRYAHLSPEYMKKAVECLNVGTKLAQENLRRKNKTMDLSQFFVNKGVK